MPTVAFSVGTALPNPIYVDSGVAIALFYKTHASNKRATSFVLESMKQTRQLFFSTLTMDELWHILMATWHREATGNKFSPKKPAHVARWSGQVQQTTNELLSLSNVRMCPPHPGADLVSRGLAALQTCNLGARDSFHLASANAAGSPAIATLDRDFEGVLTAQPAFTILKIG